jgi:DNA-binding response OmpR family regulator
MEEGNMRMQALPEHRLAVTESQPVGRSADTLDVMLIDPDQQQSLLTLRELERFTALRCVRKHSGREALESFSRARFDAIVCRQDLGDTDCWKWIHMVRSGRWGYAATPILVLCTAVERAELAPMVDEDTTLMLEADPSALASELLAVRQGAKRVCVLVVEDEEAAARAAERALTKFYQIEIARDGQEALDLWYAHRHALIVLDLMLPRVSGEEVLARILRENPYQAVIVLTAQSAPDKHQELVLAGAAGFISKPVDMHQLPEVVRRTLRAQACLNNADRSSVQESHLAELVERVRAAHYHVERGQVASAGAHLRRAILDSHAQAPSDDQWAQLLGEFDK